MIKARGERFALIGLSRGNIERLMAGKPIFTSGEELGFSGKIAIVFGETEEAIVQELKDAAVIRGIDTEIVEGRE